MASIVHTRPPSVWEPNELRIIYLTGRQQTARNFRFAGEDEPLQRGTTYVEIFIAPACLDSRETTQPTPFQSVCSRTGYWKGKKKRLENSFADDLKIVQRNIRAKNHNRLPIYLPVILIISSKMNGLKDHKIIICQLMVRSSGKKFAKLNKFVLPINLYSKVNFKNQSP